MIIDVGEYFFLVKIHDSFIIIISVISLYIHFALRTFAVSINFWILLSQTFLDVFLYFRYLAPYFKFRWPKLPPVVDIDCFCFQLIYWALSSPHTFSMFLLVYITIILQFHSHLFYGWLTYFYICFGILLYVWYSLDTAMKLSIIRSTFQY